MTAPPAQPRIYHITHVANLSAIVAQGGLLSDAAMIARGGPTADFRSSAIKEGKQAVLLALHERFAKPHLPEEEPALRSWIW